MSRAGTVHTIDLQARDAAGPNQALDRMTALAADLFDVPVALVTILDDRMQWVKSRVGTDLRKGSRQDSLCRHVVDDPARGTLVVEDLSRDPRFARNPYVVDGGFRFYAGVPLMAGDGLCIGTLCLLDRMPRPVLTGRERDRLETLAGLAVAHLEQHAILRVSEESRRLLQLAEGVAGLGHWRYVIRHDLVVWSDEVYRIHGVDRETYNPNLTGGIDFYLPEDRIRVGEALQGAIANKDGFEFELRIRRSDGAVRTVVSKAVCEIDEAGEVAALFGVFQDVTDKRADIEAANKLRQKAEAAMTSQSSLVANLSHEFRTPLNSIIGFSELLRRHLVPGTAETGYLDTIETASQGLLSLTDDVLDLARLTAGRMEMRSKPFDPQALCAQTLAMVAPQAEKRGLLLRFDAPSPPPPVLVGDPDRLRQVLLNLLSNAVKFTERGSVVMRMSVSVRQREAALTLAVEDTGMGIPPERLGELFQRFSRIERPEAAAIPGTGLGLAISKSIIETMGGSLGVRSRLGQGSVFAARLILPIDAQARTEDAGNGGAPGSLPWPSQRLLVAEDVPMNRELIRVMLAPIGCPIDFVADGDDCVRQAQSADYAMILMDIRMPKVDGVMAARIIKSLGGRLARIPILALSASNAPEDVEKCRAAGMVDYVTKPLSGRELQSKVREWLSAGRA